MLKVRTLPVGAIATNCYLVFDGASKSLCVIDPGGDGRLIADAEPWSILTDKSIIEAADLKETSLYTLAERCGIADARGFVRRFIDYEREVTGR